jgi:pimeloyl-ACP methyl ester carboxylesterase
LLSKRAVLLLLHGLGGNGRVWDSLISHCPGYEIVAPDLAGHGSGPRLGRYELSDHVEDLAGRLSRSLSDRPVSVAAHSLGAVIAVELISELARSGANIENAVLFSMKTTWPPDDLAALQRPALQPPRVFETREAAAERFLRGTGLTGLLNSSHPAVSLGIRLVDQGWEIAADPGTHALTPPPVEQLRGRIDACTCRVTLARGSKDRFASEEDMAPLGPSVVPLADCGHNPHVEAPHLIAQLLEHRGDACDEG